MVSFHYFPMLSHKVSIVTYETYFALQISFIFRMLFPHVISHWAFQNILIGTFRTLQRLVAWDQHIVFSKLMLSTFESCPSPPLSSSWRGGR